MPVQYQCLTDLDGPASPGQPDTRARLVFESKTYGQPDYCRLSKHCSDLLKHGAEDGSEMGVFHQLHEFQREDALKSRLKRYTRAGMTPQIIFVT
jgi:hypothetical protein